GRGPGGGPAAAADAPAPARTGRPGPPALRLAVGRGLRQLPGVGHALLHGVDAGPRPLRQRGRARRRGGLERPRLPGLPDPPVRAVAAGGVPVVRGLLRHVLKGRRRRCASISLYILYTPSTEVAGRSPAGT